MKRRTLFKSITAVVFSLVYCTLQFQLTVTALTANQKGYFIKSIKYADEKSCSPASTTSSGDAALTGSDNEEKVWNYFIGKALEPEAVAGIMGNMSQESGFDPENIQDPAGRTDDPSSISSGWGLIQWTPGSKVLDIAKQAGITGPIYELSTQLDIVWWHMTNTSPTGQSNILPEYKNRSTSPREAASAFEELMEGAGDPQMENRWAAADAAMQKYGDGPTVTGGGTGSAPTSSGDCTCTSSGSTTTGSNITQLLTRLAKDNGGQTSISVQAVNGATKGSANGDVQMPTRSSYKLYTAYATLRAIESGKISWGTKIWNGSSVEETMKQMIIYSNNDAAEALRLNKKIGTPGEVTLMLQGDLGLSNKTVMGSGDSDAARGSNSRSTSNDFAKFLVLLYNQNLKGVTKSNNYEKMIGFMKQATTDGTSARAGIAAGVGSGTEVADKPGWAPAGPDQASNDVGIVYARSPYVISILTDKPNQWDGVANIAKSVNQFMQNNSPSGGCSSSGAVPGDLLSTVKNYAWPDYHSAPYVNMTDSYSEAVKKAQGEGRYVGGIQHPGVDCGGFVTTAMIDSGFEPGYNSSGKGGFTGSPGDPNTQWGWLERNWQKIKPSGTSDLQPGDVAINSSHTYMYVGKIPGFNSVIASASLDSRAPMAGQETPADPSFTWYRKK